MLNRNIKVSVIITTKNEERNIEHCLSSIKNQCYPKEYIETIVIDNNSTDLSKEIARSFTDKVFNCGPERSTQRNFGVNKASSEYILYLDADMALSDSVVAECVKNCEEKGLVALYIQKGLKVADSGLGYAILKEASMMLPALIAFVL